jgi:formate-dependent nitrite reductase membrane component NrfD
MPIAAPALLGALGGLGFPEMIVILFVFVIGIGGTGVWIFMLVDCATKEADNGNTKIVWVLIIALTHIVGAAIYGFVRRPQRIAELGR